MPPKTDPKIIQQERAALQKVKLVSFAANPRSVSTFGKTTLSWKVEVPESDVDISIQLNGTNVGSSGTKTQSLTVSTTFVLTAATENAGRQLRKLTVQVDAGECRQKNFDDFLVTAMFKGEFDRRFSGNSRISLRGDKTSVALGEAEIRILVPLRINVPNFFDANMDIRIVLQVAGGGVPTVESKSLDVDVSWSLLAHLTSLGCTGLVQKGMEEMAKAFLTNIVQSELAPRLVREFTKLATDFAAGLKADDPAHRNYAMTRFHLNEEGITITACPK